MADPKIRYDIEANATGAADVNRLATELEKLDDSIDPQAAARADDLAKKLRLLGEQNAALQTFVQLKQRTEAARTALDEAQTAAQALGRQLAATETPTRAQAGAMQKLGDAVKAAKADLQAQTEALDGARAGLSRLGLETEGLAKNQIRVRQELAATATEANVLAQRYQATATAAAASSAAQAALDDALRKAETKAKETAAEFKKLADAQQEALTGAFGQTGVRSLQAIRTEISGVSESLTLLRSKYAAGAISAEDLARATSSAEVRVATLRRELQTIPALPNVFEKLNSSINDTINRFGSLTAAIAAVGFAARPVIDANIQLENLRRTLTFVTGSASEAAAQIKFLQDTADRTGLAVGQITDSFKLFEASIVKAGLSVSVAQELFGGVASAAGVLGISTERVSNILLALGQVANKGKVSLEELQGQIGEALPGALKLAADSIGVTSAELAKLLKDGRLLAEDFLPGFARQLNETFGPGAKEVDGLAQAFNRAKNAATQASQQLLDTTAYKALTSALNGVAANFDTIVNGTYSLIKAFVAFKAIDAAREFFGIKAAAEAASSAKLKDVAVTAEAAAATAVQTAAVQKNTAGVVLETEAVVANTVAKRANAGASVAAGGPLNAAAAAFGNVVTAAQGATSKIGAFISTLGGGYGVALAASIAFSDQLGNALANLAAKVTGVAGKLRENEARLLALAEAEKKAAEASAAATEVRGRGFTALQVQYDRLVDAAEKNVQVAKKLVEAKKEEGQAASTLAEISGDEAAAKAAASKASEASATAIRVELKARAEELALLEKQRAELALAAGAQSTWSEARKEFFREFDQNLEKKRADLELTRQTAEAESTAADKAAASAVAYRDNAKSLNEFKAAVEGARDVYEGQIQRFKDGLITQGQLSQSARDLATAQGLLKDAYDDATKAVQRRGVALKEQTGLQQQDVDLARAKITTDLRLADVTGQYVDRLDATTKLKALDVQQSQQKIAAAEKETSLLREEARLRAEQLRINDPLYEQKKREIDAILNAAKAKEKEGLIEQQNLRLLNIEYANIQGTLNQAAKGFTAVGDAAAEAAKKLDVFSAAGRAARNASMPGGPAPGSFGELLGATPSGGITRTAAGPTAVNRPTDGEWTYTVNSYEVEVKGVDARGNPVPGGWMRARGSTAGIGGFGGFATQPTRTPAPGFGIEPTSPSPAPAAPAAPGPAGGGITMNVTIGGKQYGIGATNQAQADAIIASLEAAYAAGGG